MASTSVDSSTTVYIGNLKTSARILELKSSLHKLLNRTLKLQVTVNDISIVNGSKRYAIIDVHNVQNVDYVLQNLADDEDRKNIKFDFGLLVEDGTWLHVDTVKSQDDKQARDDFENARNPPRPFQKPHLHVRKRPDYGRLISLKSSSSNHPAKSSASNHPAKSSASNQPAHFGRSSRQSNSTQRSQKSRSTNLDVTLDDYPIDGDRSPVMMAGDVGVHVASGGRINMVPLDDSTLKEDSDDSGTQMDPVHNRTMSSIHGDDDDSPENSEYEDPPGSVIDLRHVTRASLNSKLTPRIHRRNSKEKVMGNHMNTRSVPSSASRRDFFAFLDAQIGAESSAEQNHGRDSDENNIYVGEEGTPYYRPGEMVYNNDLSKEFKAYLDGKYTLMKIREHVARSVCGFLNSGQKGMLLIGVESRGRVVGIDCDPQQEDRFRRHFMEAVKEIYPPVFGEDYSVHFSPLLEENGRQHSSLKVIEVRVFPPANQEVLYECKEGVFVRRNGILTGPIKASHIQEWVKQRHFEELKQMQKTEAFIKEEMQRKDQMIRRQADTIMAQKSAIDQQQSIIEGGKSCVIL